MPTTSQLRIPPILDEDLFEDFCRDLWAIIWNDADAERNGRKGQSQCGVDVFGLPPKHSKHEGVQAKAYARSLTNAEIQHEIDEAKKFMPPLRKLIIACTGPRDAVGQAYVRQVNVDHRASRLFSVALLGWEDIKRLVQTHLVTTRPDLIERYFEITTTSSPLIAGVTEAVKSAVAEIGRGAFATADALPSLINQEHYQSELNYARNLVNGVKPNQALEYLTDCRDRIWSDAKPPVRYRILHYQGFANYLLGRNPEAGRNFLEALQYNLNDETALAFAALGCMLLGDNERAADYAKQALSRNPSNGKAYATLVRTIDTGQPFDQLLEAVPEPYRRLPEAAIGLSEVARRRGMLAEAEQWCRLAIEEEQENWADPHGVLGEILMQQAFLDGPVVPGLKISEKRREQLEAAEASFTQAWERVAQTEIKSTRVSWLVNRGAARCLLGRMEDGAQDYDAALILDPEDAALILRRANLAIQIGETSVATDLILRARPSVDQTELSLMQAELLMELGRYEDAERIAESLLARHLPASAAVAVNRIQLRIEIGKKEWDKAQERFAAIRAARPEDIDVMADGAWLYRLAGDMAVSRELLKEASALLKTDSLPSQLLTIATEWFEHSEYSEAAHLYEKLADRDTYSPITRQLLLCLYNSADLGLALELSQHLLSLHGPLPAVSQIAVAILDEAGDLPNARRIGEEYLALFPADFEMRLRVASVLQRLGDTAGVDAFLETPVSIESLPMKLAFRVAALHAYRGQLRRALDIAYEVRRKHIDESEAHLFYVSIFLKADRSGDEEPSEIHAGLDTAVCIQDEAGREEWHVIEDRDDNRAPAELMPNHPLAKKLIGLGAGATVTIKENDFSTETATVTAVVSKFVYALQESMRTFERMFPDKPGLWNIKLPMVGDSAEMDFDPFFRMITRQHDRYLNVERLYREGQIPFGMAAKLIGNNVLQTWSLAVSKPEFGIQCSRGTPGELDAARKLLAMGSILVLDPISLLTLFGLETRDALTARFGKFAVPQSLIDMLQRIRQENSGIRSGGFITVGKEGDQFIRDEVTPEHIQGNIAYLDGLLKWIGTNCTVVPIDFALDKSRLLRAKLEDMMDRCLVDSILIANGNGRILYSDDERFRALTKSEIGTEGTWTQVLLAMALDEGVIDSDSYSGDIVRLLASNYSHVYVNPGIFLVAARKADWRPVHPFSAVVKILSGSKSDLESATTVAAEAIYGIWKEHLMEHQRSFLVTELLNGLSSGRNRSAVLSILVPKLERRFYLLPLHYHDLCRFIAIWTRAHRT